MAEYVGNEARAVKPGDPIILTSYCRSAFAIGAGLIFNADGEYLVSVNGNHMVVRDYPLTAVHDHGRLVDADALLKQIDGEWNGRTAFRAATIIEYINDAPTIIPADKEATDDRA